MNGLKQSPAPGSYSVVYRGDVVEFLLTVPDAPDGKAWLRTNIGHAVVHRREIIRAVEQGKSILSRDWHDIAMERVQPDLFRLCLPVLEPGCFKAKSFFLPAGQSEPLWPAGDNARIKVEPEAYAGGNSLYTAFVRQFHTDGRQKLTAEQVHAVNTLEKDGYHVIPQSGTFRNLIKELDFITGTLRCRIIQLLPIHPTPTTYARMGRYGSPFAVIDFMDVDPALAEFDRQTTPLQQFIELVDAVHARGARLFLDIPINHTGWASTLQVHHPEWFERTEDDRFRSPGAWGVTWEDLSQLNYEVRHLWEYIAEVFLFWCRQGVDGFRCDAGYMVPEMVWEYVVAKVRTQYPDTIFMLEGLGGKVTVTESLMSKAGLDWAYSELFQQYTREQIEYYLPDAIRISQEKGLLIHFAETHDNNRLAATSSGYARMRTALAALLSDGGGFGITNGVEWLATEKVDVHGAPSMNWGCSENLVEHIQRLNTIVSHHPAFVPGVPLRLVHNSHDNAIALLRSCPAERDTCLVIVNLNHTDAGHVSWRCADFDPPNGQVVDLLANDAVTLCRENDAWMCHLGPGQVFLLSIDTRIPARIDAWLAGPVEPEERTLRRLSAKALDIIVESNGLQDVSALNTTLRGQSLARDPWAYCVSAFDGIPRVTTWTWPADVRRKVMIPPGNCLLVRAPHRFSLDVSFEQHPAMHDHALPAQDGSWFAVLLPKVKHREHTAAQMQISVFAPDESSRGCAPLLFLSHVSHAEVYSTVDQALTRTHGLYTLCGNESGAMAQVQGCWGELRSQYDALLAGNLHPSVPSDRQVMLTRCRVWLVYRGYSQSVDINCLNTFSQAEDGTVAWRFSVPGGLGKLVPLSIVLRLCPGGNRIELTVARHKARGAHRLDDHSPVRIIVRPDIEDRSSHASTKAYAGPEHTWPQAVEPAAQGFVFSPYGDHALHMQVDEGTFVHESEWQYMVGHPFEAKRGLEPNGDLFSPGYFTFELTGGRANMLAGEITVSGAAPCSMDMVSLPAPTPETVTVPIDTAMERALATYVVRRGNGKTVLAGYPWFLDWGRDTLIALRGMIAAGYHRESCEILLQFATMERNGTLPNMLIADDDTNRDTSDAPLWFCVACRDLLLVAGEEILDASCGERALRDVLLSIGEHLCRGAENGVKMDQESGLLYSPSHYTWMDTNHPAGTPRQGYAVEIQALWYAALSFLATVEGEAGERWSDLAAKVQASLMSLFVREDQGYLCDCLHADAGTPAAVAVADDALRSNQLLALTLGAVTDRALSASILRHCEELLVPGAIRSLADRPVSVPIPVSHNGVVLNDPHQPYQGHYCGDEDTRRKPAYHNGTAWTWPFPSYAEAMVSVYGDAIRPQALAILHSATELINRDCLGHVPEIVDGDAPHISRGCGAQAWGVSELYRVLKLLR
ncbi:MAG: glycogen debranching enzyme N-terminal domain-containing protein [Kiritimatiellae bacterium]|nr:glycogen debranching enzyme N-terminal domain-containing protein [Kiritimatiellia bacterium]